MNSLLTDPANHPANGNLPVQRIERVIEALESSLKYRNGNSMDHFVVDAVKGLRELRESREAVPVAWMYDGEDGREYNGHNEFPYGGKGVPLYAAPPAPVVLPKQHWEELCLQHPDMSIGDAIIRAAWWNHCVAMLQESPKGAGAPQNCRSNENVQVVDRQSVDHVDGESCCGNSPVTPGGWIPVSERMPKVGEYVLCLDGLDRHGHFAHDDVYTAAYCDRLGSFTTEYYGDHDWMSKSNPMYWSPIPKMPLPAAPKEVG